MTEKEKLFSLEYLRELNGTRAYLAVYKNCKSERAAAACAARLLTKANIKDYVDEQLAIIKSEKVADAQEVMEYLTTVLRGDSTAEIVVVADDCVRHVNKTPDEKERLKAAELLGKRYSLFTDKVQAEVNEAILFEGEDKLAD